MRYRKLLNLARRAIEMKLTNNVLKIEESIKEEFKYKGASFVTLTINDNLRGCIGSLIASKPLWEDVVENALNASFNDFRFNALTKDELDKINIEISILTPMEEISFVYKKDLFKKIKNKGVYIKKGIYTATFLPQVWEQLPDEKEFLEHLCIKGGLLPDSWEKQEMKIYVYDVKKFKES